MAPPAPETAASKGAQPATDVSRWSDRRWLARLLKLIAVVAPIVVSVLFVAVASRAVRRPDQWTGVVAWWLGLTLASTVVLAATERVLRKLLPLAALFRLSLVFPDHAPSRFKVAMRTNTLRQLQRSLEAGEVDIDFQEAAERLVALAGALNAHDRMTRGHTERVRAYTLMIGEELHLAKADLDRLHWAGLVHDIGKLEVPPSILNKPGRPDEAEWAILKQHPAAAVRLLEPLRPWLGEWADAASQHHERWDGKGYPFGLAGEQISLSGRIVAVADAFDVMTSVRSYKKAMTPEAARAELARCAGSQFDPEVVRAFLNISVGKLRLVMGPLSWVAQAPALGNVPVGAGAMTMASSMVSLGIAVAAGLTSDSPADRTTPPAVAFADAATAQTIAISGVEDEPLTLDLGDLEEPPTSLRIVTVPPHLSVDSSSPTTLIPEQNWFGQSSGEYEACWDDECSTAAVTFDVQSVNDLPVAADDGATTPRDTPIMIDVLANDIDVEDGRPLLASVDPGSSPAGGTASVTAEGLVHFQPHPGFVGSVTVGYRVVDQDEAAADGRIVIEVTSVETPPHAADDEITTRAGTTESIDVLANDVDDGNDPLTIIAVTPPAIGQVVLSPDSVTYQSPPGTSGQTSFTYVVEDDDGGRGQATVRITIVDDPPVPSTSPPPTTTTTQPTTTPPTPTTTIVVPPPATPTARPDHATLIEDAGPSEIDVLANDSSADDDFANDTLAILTPPARGAALVVAQRIRYQPALDTNGLDTIVYRVCEATNTCDTAALTITIEARNDPPEFLAVGEVDVLEDSGPATVPGWATSITAGPANEIGQNVGFTVTTDQPGLFSDLPAIDAAGTLTFTPAPDSNGTATITVAAIDDGGTSHGGNDTSATHTSTITITPVNDTPDFDDQGDIAAVEDSGPFTVTGWVTAIRPGPANEAAESVVFAVDVDQPTLFAAPPAVDAAGTLTFTPAADANGTTTLTVIAVDDGGTNHGGNDTSPTHTATITITAVADLVVAGDDAATIVEDDPAGSTIDVLANDTDADNDALTIVSIDTSGVAGGTVTDLGGGSINYTADANFNGTEAFTYTVTDGNSSTVTATVTITVTPTPDAPVATADAFSTAEDTTRVVPAPGLLANDYDEDGESLAVTLAPIAGPSNGMVTLAADGSFTYTPVNGFIGTDAFTYQVTDSTGQTATGTATVTVDSGLAAGQLYLGSTPALGTWNMTVGPAANATPEPDRDSDGNPGITVAKDGLFGTQTWVRTISDSSLTLNGPVTLELWSTIEDFHPNHDGHPEITLLDCNTLGLGCVTVAHTETHINHYNDGVADWVKVDISLGNIAHSFAVGRQLRLQIEQGHHDLWIATSGTRPSRLSYTLANTAPVANDDTPPAILEDPVPVSIDVLANDIDSNIDATAVTITTPPGLGTATRQPDGTITYQPAPDTNGVDSFTYRVCDTGGLCDTATVTINITAVNDSPGFTVGPDITINAADPAYTQANWATAIIAGPANESGQAVSFTVSASDPTLFSTQPAISPTGTLTFTPSGIPGSTTLTIQISDNGGTANGGSNTAPPQTATITLN